MADHTSFRETVAMTQCRLPFYKYISMQRKIVGLFVGIATTCLFASLASVPVQADTVGFAYSFAGADAPPVQSGTTLIIEGSATGSFQTHDTILDAVWNPVTFQDHCIVDLTTGLLNGTINFAFADGAELFGNEFEDVHELIATNGQGAFTGALTFTGGTAEFAGATGSVSLAGLGTSTGFTESGNGNLSASAVSAAPEPASILLFFGGLLMLTANRKLFRRPAHS
jgi:hypothetical protein